MEEVIKAVGKKAVAKIKDDEMVIGIVKKATPEGHIFFEDCSELIFFGKKYREEYVGEKQITFGSVITFSLYDAKKFKKFYKMSLHEYILEKRKRRRKWCQ